MEADQHDGYELGRRPEALVIPKIFYGAPGVMNITYRFRVDESYYRNLIDRFYRQGSVIRRPSVQFGILAFIVAALLVGQASVPTAGVLLGATVAAALMFVGGVSLTTLGILRRFRRKADFGTEATVTLSEEGIAAHGEHVQGKWDWAAYHHAVRFSDGILLLRPGVIRWLPDAGISTGTATEATALVATKFKVRDLT